MDKDEIVRLMETPSGELAEMAPSEWNKIISNLHPDDLRLLSNSLIRLAEKAVRMAIYIDVRSGRNHKITDHAEGVRAQNEVAEKLRRLLEFQEPKADIDF